MPEINEVPVKPDVYSEKPKLTIHASLKESLGVEKGNAYIASSLENSHSPEYQVLLYNIGLNSSQVEIRKFSISRDAKTDVHAITDFVSVRFPYNKSADIVYLVHASDVKRASKQGSYRLGDIVLVSRTTGNAFSLRGDLGDNAWMNLDCGEYLSANGGDPQVNYSRPNDRPIRTLRTAPLGSKRAPDTRQERVFWNIARRFDAAVLMHELGHTNELRDTQALFAKNEALETLEDEGKGLRTHNQRYSILRERAAWRWALQAMRQLKDRGIDLTPNLTNSQIISRIEFVLITGKDLLYTPPIILNKRFSNKVRQPNGSEGQEINQRRHYVSCMRAFLRVVKQDPSILRSLISLGSFMS